MNGSETSGGAAPAGPAPPWEPSKTEVRQLAQRLASLRPLVPYPGWQFDADWNSPDFPVRMRRRLFEYCLARQWELPVEVPWYDGLRLCLYLSNDTSRQVFIAGCVDPNEFVFLDQVLRPGMVFIDAGANEGLYSLFAARRVAAAGSPRARLWRRLLFPVKGDGKVLAFEPSRREYARLRHNIGLNRLSNVRPFRVALGEREGNAELLIANAEHAGQNSLGGFVHQGVEVLRRETVRLRRLDDVIREEGLARVDLIKLDVEGAEVRVLRGSSMVLRELRPLLLFEVLEESLRRQGSSGEELFDLLRRFQYAICVFDAQTGLPRLAAPGERSPNMIAVPEEKPLPETLLRAESSSRFEAP